MTVESASFISGLNASYPPGSDSISEGDDHLRLIKTVLKATLPNADEAINGVHTGTTGSHNIATAHDVTLTSTSGTSMAYRIKTLNQSASKTTRIQAVSLGWS